MAKRTQAVHIQRCEFAKTLDKAFLTRFRFVRFRVEIMVGEHETGAERLGTGDAMTALILKRGMRMLLFQWFVEPKD